MKSNKIIYTINNILFMFYIVALIKLIPNIKECGNIGVVFIVFSFIDILLTIFFFLQKKENVIYNNLNNILSIFFYIYVYLIVFKYLTSLTNMVDINIIYYKINYGLAIIASLGVLTNSLFLQKE